MAKPVLMPKLSSTMTHGSVTEWFVNEGDYVEVGQAIFEVMTDKIAIEVESYDEGYILKKYIDINEEVPCNSIIAYIGEQEEEVPETMDYSEEGTEEVVEPEVEVREEVREYQEVNEKGIRATPYARKLAKEKGIDLSAVHGSGRKGRIQAQDILNYTPSQQTISPVIEEDVEIIPWKGMRKSIADAMVNSKNTIPHVTMNTTVNIQKLMEVRKELNAINDGNITVTDMFSLAVVKTLKVNPKFNARTSDKGIHQYKHINLGIAVSLEDGLVVPVIRNAHVMGLSEISENTRNIAEGARNNSLNPDSYKEGTFTISSLGKTVVRSFNPIINYPEVAILGVGGMYTIHDTKYIDLSLSFDHRVVDGYPATQFMDTLVSMIENPTLMIL